MRKTNRYNPHFFSDRRGGGDNTEGCLLSGLVLTIGCAATLINFSTEPVLCVILCSVFLGIALLLHWYFNPDIFK